MQTSTRLVGALLLCICLPLYAETPDDQMLSWFDEVLKACHAKLDDWRFSYHVQVGIAIIVSVLGLLAAALQGLTSSFVKITTVVLGLVISAVTAAVNVLDMNSYKQVHADLTKAEKAVIRMEAARTNFKMFKKPDNEVAAAEFKKQYDRYQAIIDPPEEGKGEVVHEFKLFSAAYAEGNEPAWVKEVPNSSRNIYFVGVADSARLPDAQTESIRSAKASANELFRDTLQGSTTNSAALDSATSALTGSADEVDSHITYDDKTGLYRYYSLIRVNRSQAQSNTHFAYLQNGVQSPVAVFDSTNDAQRRDADYAGKRLRLQEQQIDQTSKLLNADQYRKFSDARQARRSGATKEAIPALEDIVAQQPEFYLGWFNLALAYSKNQDELHAREAYKRAVALEPSQTARDSSVYNAYGHFLLERRQYCDSVKLFEQAVIIEPLNTLAQRNLEKAKSDLADSSVECM